jgi:hypothetical protein
MELRAGCGMGTCGMCLGRLYMGGAVGSRWDGVLCGIVFGVYWGLDFGIVVW